MVNQPMDAVRPQARTAATGIRALGRRARRPRVLSGSANPLTGAPGAVILYALVAVLAWPTLTQTAQAGREPADPVAAGSPLGLTGARVCWLALWGSSAYFMLQAVNRAPGAVRDTFAGLASGEPGWIAALDRGLASAASGQGLAISIGLAVVFVAAGLGVFWSATTRPALLLSVIVAVAIWVLGENFGGILTGQGTDPSTGLVLVLLAAAYWPLHRRPADPVSHDQGNAPVIAQEEMA